MKLQEKTKKVKTIEHILRKSFNLVQEEVLKVIERFKRANLWLRLLPSSSMNIENTYDWYGDHRLKIGQRYYLLEHLTLYGFRTICRGNNGNQMPKTNGFRQMITITLIKHTWSHLMLLDGKLTCFPKGFLCWRQTKNLNQTVLNIPIQDYGGLGSKFTTNNRGGTTLTTPQTPYM